MIILGFLKMAKNKRLRGKMVAKTTQKTTRMTTKRRTTTRTPVLFHSLLLLQFPIRQVRMPRRATTFNLETYVLEKEFKMPTRWKDRNKLLSNKLMSVWEEWIASRGKAFQITIDHCK